MLGNLNRLKDTVEEFGRISLTDDYTNSEREEIKGCSDRNHNAIASISRKRMQPRGNSLHFLMEGWVGGGGRSWLLTRKPMTRNILFLTICDFHPLPPPLYTYNIICEHFPSPIYHGHLELKLETIKYVSDWNKTPNYLALTTNLNP